MLKSKVPETIFILCLKVAKAFLRQRKHVIDDDEKTL